MCMYIYIKYKISKGSNMFTQTCFKIYLDKDIFCQYIFYMLLYSNTFCVRVLLLFFVFFGVKKNIF